MKRLLILLLLIGCSEKKPGSLLAPQAFDIKLKATENAIVLDVRTVEEVNTGTLENAINIVYDKNFADKLDALEQKPVFVYCEAGGRSAKAAHILREKGFEVFELDGGIRAWKDAGMPVR
ncbi:MAG: rhodanese-like domain-containing protein [Cyclobacteriaceae bacterium]|nr:rhodanese-like domain-containing protein [Cyclobacteriaceae bacterium]